MSDNTADRISDGLDTAAQITQAANDAKLIKTGKASGWLGFFSLLTGLFGKRKGSG